MSEDTRDRVAQAVGHAIRRARGRLDLSMRDVAAKAGMSQPFLSDLENGRAMPSIATLYRLADTFGLAPQDLLPPSPGDDIVVVRAGTGPLSPVDDTPGVAMSRLLAGGPGRMIEARRYSLAPDQPVGDWFEHEGEDLLFVLDGVVRIEFGTGTTERLATGDTLWHSGLIPHRWRSDPDVAAALLLVNGRLSAAPADNDHD